MGVYVYIDGFNFYYGLFKNKRRYHQLPAHYKWLDLLKLSQAIAPDTTIAWIGYFTAYVKQVPRDPDQHLRQRAYIEALRTLTNLEVIPGNFQPTTKWGVPHQSISTQPMKFDTFEEKGSDVNLAVRLVWDAAQDAFSEAVVISNDSDLREAVRIVTQEARKPVRVVSPDVSVNNALKAVATRAAPLDVRLFKRCLFAETLTNSDGVIISRPSAWSPRAQPPKRQHR
ncbi:MAG: NYN domain-containing protein [Chloroflexota bacterium]|nr:NYN domain-containing protein [Chloroflexota bacterium]